MKKNIIYLLTLLLLCCFRQNIHAEYFRNLNLGNGLSQFSVMSICQDSLGRMWFGTHEGINITSDTIKDGWKAAPEKSSG